MTNSGVRACQYADLPDVVLLGDLRRPGLGDVLDRVETAPILQVAAAAVLPRLAGKVVFRQCAVFGMHFLGVSSSIVLCS